VYAFAVVAAGTTTVADIFTGLPAVGFTLVPGAKLQVELEMAALQETLTLWSNEPAAVT
jgi:hypothetical protein